jgi:O-Antigen ligase
MTFEAGTLVRVLPSGALAAAAFGLAWLSSGSTVGADWAPYACFAGLLLAVVLVSGSAVTLRRRELVVVAALVALAAWAAISITWSATPALARDEALLTLFYAIAFTVPLLSLRTSGERLLASAAVAAGAGLLAVGAAVVLRFGSDQTDHYSYRLTFPISYPNALAAVFLIGFWPAVVLAAQRRRALPTRALALAAATAIASGWLTAQSKGGIAAIAVSGALVFGFSPLRLRLVPPTFVASGLTAAAYVPLTAPYRTGSASDVRSAGSAILLLTALGALAGLCYGLADRRVALGARGVRLAGITTLAVFVAAVGVGIAMFFTRVYYPGWFEHQWRTFKVSTQHPTTSSHLFQLGGSYRYDIWRVALQEFADHPLAGIGSRGFGPAYLERRHSYDTAARAHSVELDALSELGIVGFVLLACGLALPLVSVIPRMRRRDPAATAAFAGAAYWLVHASVDWIWTVPACGLAFWLLVGAGSSGGERPPLPRKATIPASVVTLVIAVAAFVPPWLSARLTDRGQFGWAKRLDPLAVEPYVAQAASASSPRAAAAALRRAVRKEPRVVELHFDLALAYARAHDFRRARAELKIAHRLDPRDPRIDSALKELPKRSVRSS